MGNNFESASTSDSDITPLMTSLTQGLIVWGAYIGVDSGAEFKHQFEDALASIMPFDIGAGDFTAAGMFVSEISSGKNTRYGQQVIPIHHPVSEKRHTVLVSPPIPPPVSLS